MINLLVTLDSNYVNPLCSLIHSITLSNRTEKFRLFAAHSSLTQADFEKMEAAAYGGDFEICPILLSDSLFEGAPTKKRITKETYYRIFAPLYLPKDVDRVLYIDPDTVVINSLSEFYNAGFGDNLIIGAKHFDGFMDSINRKRLFMKKSLRYINAGVMLMNIEEMRKTFNEGDVYSIIEKKCPYLFLADQDVINILYDGKIGLYSEFVINLDERTFKHLPPKTDLDFVRKNTAVIHYNGKYKPWKQGYKGSLDVFYGEYGLPERRLHTGGVLI